MKKNFLLDVLFIIVCACICTFLYKRGLENIIISFQLIFLLIAYFLGKFVGKLEVRNKIKRDQKNI
jgi:hypothetical protein